MKLKSLILFLCLTQDFFKLGSSQGCTEGDVRLLEGSTPREGRVEVCRNNAWGTVCDDGWGTADARVVCRQLSLSVAGPTALSSAHFGQGTGPILLNNVGCRGSEARLIDCSSQSGTITSCSHFEDAGVRCHEQTNCMDGDLRLVGGTNTNEGRVEMCYSGVWGTVCDNNWGRGDVAVVCRQLGFSSSGATALSRATFGQGTGPIFLDQVMCRGLEYRLIDCVNRGIEVQSCSHSEDAGVRCVTGCTEGELRLVGGANYNEGRVEICRSDEWGTVCDQMWDVTDASVVCRQQGFPSTGAVSLTGASFGQGTGRIWLYNVQCTGNERVLMNCTASIDGSSTCTHARDAGVRCQSGCMVGDVRLLEGSNHLEGRVEVCRNNMWGTVCDDGWSGIDARVVCRQLNLSVAGTIATISAIFGQGTGPILMNNVGCRGSEARLIDCSSQTGTITGCSHFEDAGVRCRVQTNCMDGDLRLVGGTNTNEGRVEMCYSGVWGTVCDNNWGRGDVAVVCRQLGFSSSGATALSRAAFGQGSGPIFLDQVMCRGLEYRLIDCVNRGIEVQSCSHSEDAGVRCVTGCTEGELRLVGGANYNEGRVEICRSDEWGTVCDQMWDVTDASVVCRQQGFPSTGAVALTGASFGQGTGRIWLNNVQCTVNDRVLMNCTANVGSNTCTHAQDAGVRCQSGCTEGDVRLLEGTTKLEGRVEVCRNNMWGTVCDDGWSGIDAMVVCRQLDFSVAGSSAVSLAGFGQGTGPILMNNVACRGSEARLIDCSSQSGTITGCSHFEDAGVRCRAQAVCMDGDLRLVGGTNMNEGRVEMCYSGVWGTVCDNSWTIGDAAVVCRQLGFSSTGATALSRATFGQGSGPIFLDQVMCRGVEYRLIDCANRGIQVHGCSHSEDAGVRCVTGCTEGELRLVGGGNSNEGRVEICRSDEWGTVCDQMWDDADAIVTCRQLGLSSTGASAVTMASFGQGTGRIWLYNVQCTGNERALMNCTASIDGSSTCTHARDAGVRCQSGCTLGDVRLLEGSTPREGRVEVCRNNAWGTVCDDGWGTADARVVCRQLSLSVAGPTALSSAHFGQGTGSILLNNVACRGNEARLVDCSSGTVTSCSHSEDAGVRCRPQENCIDGDLRLIGGNTQYEGRVEMCYSGVWGTVCDNRWGRGDAAVVCRQLGFSSSGAIAFNLARFGQGGGRPIFLSDVMCRGVEYRLIDCVHRDIEDNSCSHSEDAGVRCVAGCTEGELRLVGGANYSQGRVEICRSDEWGTVCDQMWDVTDARVVCRQQGFPSTGAVALTGASFGQGTGRIWLYNVQCTGSERVLMNCTASIDGSSTCTHARDAGVRCQSGCPEGDIRLLEGPSRREGRVEVCRNNMWGSVCDDGFGTDDARVVCRQLDFSTSGPLVISNAALVYGYGVGSILLNNLACQGNEARLIDCRSGTVTSCSHSEDAGVRCHSQTNCMDGDLRLVGGNSIYEGRVEICYSGVWGTVCDNSWTRGDAEVVCRELGFSSTGAIALRLAFFGQGGGPIFLSDLMCRGVEYRLVDCDHSDIEDNSCSHSEDAGVRCRPGCAEGELRLVGGANYNEGRVEICRSDEWGTVCDQMWDVTDASVVCRQQGFPSTGAVALTGASFGQGTGRIWLYNVQCTGSERVLMNCTASINGNSTCTHAQDAGVRCQSGCTEGDIRLLEGPSRREGRVEVCRNNMWGSVCDDGFGTDDARVICRQLDFSTSGPLVISNAALVYGYGVGSILLNNLACQGNEARLIDCPSGTVTSCSHSEDAGVRCHSQTNCMDGDLRLIGGNSIYEGRVEICFSGVWGTVCDNMWTRGDAEVVCRELGYSSAGATAYRLARFGQGGGPIFISDVKCRGTEYRLIDCGHGGIEDNSCSHSEDAGVTCLPGCAEGELRLVGGANYNEGRVEICQSNEWGTVCDQMWDVTDASVVCRQQGFPSTGAVALTGASFGQGTGRIWLYNVQCTGSERVLMNCTASIDGSSTCTHAQDAGVRCQSGCTEGDIRLLEGPSSREGRVEICRNNIWGSVCVIGWGTEDARVVCRQLNFSISGPTAINNAASVYGYRVGPYLLSNVACQGSEARLIDCPSGTVTSCSDTQGAGVRCRSQTNCMDGDVRLIGGNTIYEGRVEICYSGVWGTVCDNNWNTPDATVVCRQLGFSTIGALTFNLARYGQGGGPIFLSGLQCIGNEATLFDCPTSVQIEATFCSHSEDAGLRCLPPPTTSPPPTTPSPTTPSPTTPSPTTPPPSACSAGSVRLQNGASNLEGRVEVCFSGQWGTVCDSNWDTNDARVVCRQLGFSMYNAVALGSSHFGAGVGAIVFGDVNCVGTEQSIFNCTAGLFPNCLHALNDAGVRCSLPVPRQVTNLTTVLSQSNCNTVTISWSAPPAEEAVINYAITVRNMIGVSTSFISNTESIVVPSLQCCANYTYQVTARSSSGLGTPSQIMSFNTIVDYDATMLSDLFVVSTETGSSYIVVSWQSRNGVFQQSLQSVRVVIRSTIDGTQTHDLTTLSNSVNATGLAPFVPYEVLVYVTVCQRTYQAYSERVTISIVPSSPSNLKAVPLQSDCSMVTINWRPPPEAQQSGIINGYGITLWNMLGTPSSFINSSTTSVVVNGLECCTNYTYQVAGRTTQGLGPPSQNMTFTTGVNYTVLMSNFIISRESGSNFIAVSWEIRDAVIQRGLETVRVGIVSAVDGTQAQIFDIFSDQNRSVNATGLDPSVPYNVYVTAAICGGVFMLHNETVIILQVPGSPTNLNVVPSSSDCTSVTITWTPPTGSVTDYSVTVRDEASGSSTSDTTSNTGSLVINSLQCCASYTYQVSARNGAGRGSPSQSMSFNTNVDFNALRTYFTVSTETDNSYILVRWQVSNALLRQALTSVQVEVVSTADSTRSQSFNVTTNQQNLVNATGIVPFVAYNVRVTAVVCRMSTEVYNQAVTIEIQPGSPTNLNAVLTQGDCTMATISWNAPSGPAQNGVTGYTVMIWDMSGVSSSLLSTTTSVVVNSLRCCTNYNYRVVARTNAGLDSSSQNRSFTTTIDYNALRANYIVSTETGNSYIVVRWEINDAILRQELQSVQVAVISTVNSSQALSFNVLASQQNINVTRLDPFVPYLVTLTAVGCQTSTQVYNETITIQIVPGPPTGLRAVLADNDCTTVTLSWTPPPEANLNGIVLGYNVTVWVAGGVSSSFISTTETTIVNPLQCCMDYTYQVTPRGRTGLGTPSQVGRFSTNIAYSVFSNHFTVSTEIDSSYILVRWQVSNALLRQALRSVQVEVVSTADPTQAQSFNVTTSQQNLVNATGIVPFVAYNVRVTAVVCQTSTLAYNQAVTIQIEPGSPTNLNAVLTQGDCTMATISWNAPSGPGVTGYTVMIWDMSGVSSSLLSTSTSAVVNSLRCCTNYNYRVVARTNAGLDSSSQNRSFTTAIDYNALRTNFIVNTESGNSYILVRWEITDAVLQQEIDSVQGAVTSTRDSSQTQSFNVLASQQRINATGLDPFVPYVVTVTAVGCQTSTPVYNETVTIQIVPRAPTGLRATVVSANDCTTVSLSWNAPPEADRNGVVIGYNVTVWDMNGVPSSFTSNTENVLASPLECCSSYTFQVVARTSEGMGTPSEIMSFSTNIGYNGGINVLAAAGQGSDYTISWQSGNPAINQSIRLIRVEVTSECPTGIMATQTRSFSAMSGRGTFTTRLEPSVPYRVEVTAMICQSLFEVYNRTTTIQGVNQISIPTIGNIVRSKSTAANFEIILSQRQSNVLILYNVSYYTNEGNTFNENNPVRTFLTNESSVSIDNLSPCSSYWVVVVAISCSNRVASAPQLINLFQTMEFKFMISLDNNGPCKTWVTENLPTKLSDVEQSLTTVPQDSICRLALPCVANGQFVCENDPNTVVYQTLLVSTDSFSSSQQLQCLTYWIAKTNELSIAGTTAKVTGIEVSTTSTPSPSTPSYVWAIIAVVIGGVLMAVILAVVIYTVWRQKRRSKWMSSRDGTIPNPLFSDENDYSDPSFLTTTSNKKEEALENEHTSL